MDCPEGAAQSHKIVLILTQQAKLSLNYSQSTVIAYTLCTYMYMYVSSSYSPGDEFRAILARTHREEPQIIVLACFHNCTALERGLRQTIELSGPRMCELAEQNIEYDFNGL